MRSQRKEEEASEDDFAEEDLEEDLKEDLRGWGRDSINETRTSKSEN